MVVVVVVPVAVVVVVVVVVADAVCSIANSGRGRSRGRSNSSSYFYLTFPKLETLDVNPLRCECGGLGSCCQCILASQDLVLRQTTPSTLVGRFVKTCRPNDDQYASRYSMFTPGSGIRWLWRSSVVRFAILHACCIAFA